MVKNYAPLPEAVIMYTKTEALKEVKDMSRNLVSGDFERDYKGCTRERNGRRQWWVNGFALAMGALAGCLLVLTVIRELQIARLRQEVEELSANMIAMSARVDSLDRKLLEPIQTFRTSDDTIYTDEEESNILVEETKDPDKEKQSNDSLEKLHGLTVLEDEDDDDLYDDEDVESGDYYQDYDKRKGKIGTTNMVRLTPEDFTSNVLTFAKEKQPSEAQSATIRQIKRLLNENPENPNIALSTLQTSTNHPAASTEPGSERAKRSVFSDAFTSTVDHFSVPRVAAKTEERRKTKKFNPSLETTSTGKVTSNVVSRMARNSDNEAGYRRPFIAAHFHGNTSHLIPEIHEHYKGNGLVRVAHEAPHDVWYPSPWTLAMPPPRPTLTRTGHVHVHYTGVYLVYVQIYYLDTHDIISWVLHRTNAETEGRETLLQCAQSAHSPEPLEKPNSCFSAAALFLKAGDRLAVRNTGGDRHSLMQPEKSFIGLFKLADAEDPNQEM